MAVCPNLYYREAPGASPDDAAAASRAPGGVPDDRLVGDVGGAMAYLRARPASNGKVGTIGYCSGGRQSFLAGVSLPLDAAVDCYGAFVVGTPPGDAVQDRPDRGPGAGPGLPAARPVRRRGLLPSPRDEVAELDKALTEAGRRTSSTATRAPGTPSSPWTGPATGRRPRWTAGPELWDFYGRYLRG